MSTRAYIGKLAEDGTIQYIYCHIDGDVDGVGRLLYEHYRSAEAVDGLLALGDIRILGRDAGTDYTTAFHRDWGRELIPARTVNTREAYLKALDSTWTEFAYLLDGGSWLVAHTTTGGFIYQGPNRSYSGCFVDLESVLPQ